MSPRAPFLTLLSRGDQKTSESQWFEETAQTALASNELSMICRDAGGKAGPGAGPSAEHNTMGEVVKIGPKDRRRATRRHRSIPVMLDHFLVEVIDLSLTGMGAGTLEIISSCDINIAAGQNVTLRFPHQIPYDGDIEFTGGGGFGPGITVEIVRVADGEARFGARFVDLTHEQARELARLIEGCDW